MLAASLPLYAPPRTHSQAARRATLLAVFFSALAACGLLSGAAHAAEVAAAAPSLWGDTVLPKLLALVLDPQVWLAALGLAYLLIVRRSAHKRKIDEWIAVAFGMVEDAKARGLLPPGADKAALALGHLKALASADGTKLGPEALALAQAAWSALNAQTKAQVASAVPTGTSVQTVSVPLPPPPAPGSPT